MLNVEDTLYHIRRAKEGDNASKEILLNNNSLLLKSLIRRFRGKGVEYDDLYQLASIGFLKAINNFDESFGVRFSTYAVPMIIGEVKRFLRDDGSIKVSRLIKAQSSAINKYIEQFKGKSGESPTIEQISKDLKIDEGDVVIALDSSKMPVSLNETADDENKTELIDKIPAAIREDDMIDKILLKTLLDKLPPRERKIIFLRYYRDNTQSEIAKMMGVSQVQISRIENKVIEQLRIEI